MARAAVDVKIVRIRINDHTPCIALMLVQLISTAVDGTTLALQRVNLAHLVELEQAL